MSVVSHRVCLGKYLAEIADLIGGVMVVKILLKVFVGGITCLSSLETIFGTVIRRDMAESS